MSFNKILARTKNNITLPKLNLEKKGPEASPSLFEINI